MLGFNPPNRPPAGGAAVAGVDEELVAVLLAGPRPPKRPPVGAAGADEAGVAETGATPPKSGFAGVDEGCSAGLSAGLLKPPNRLVFEAGVAEAAGASFFFCMPGKRLFVAGAAAGLAAPKRFPCCSGLFMLPGKVGGAPAGVVDCANRFSDFAGAGVVVPSGFCALAVVAGGEKRPPADGADEAGCAPPSRKMLAFDRTDLDTNP